MEGRDVTIWDLPVFFLQTNTEGDTLPQIKGAFAGESGLQTMEETPQIQRKEFSSICEL